MDLHAAAPPLIKIHDGKYVTDKYGNALGGLRTPAVQVPVATLTGLGNTGNHDFGFGNTGNNDIGFGLTGDNQVGFGGLNSGAGNIGFGLDRRLAQNIIRDLLEQSILRRAV